MRTEVSTNVAGDSHIVDRRMHDYVWERISPQARKLFRESTDNIDVVLYIQSCVDQRVSPAEGMLALAQHDVRSQWRYEQAAMYGFPHGWDKWPLPESRPDAPKRGY